MDSVPVHVLLILENAGSGSGRHVLDLARGLLARGARVTLMYSRSRLEGWFDTEMRALRELQRVTLDMRPGVGPADLLTVRRVRRYIQDHGPFDIVHGHSSKGGALARLGARGLPGVRIYTPHAFYTLGAKPGSLRERFYAAIERFLARYSDGIVCVSAAEKAHAADALGLPVDKLFTVPNGLGPLPPVDRAAVRRELQLDAGDLCVGFVGRLASQKAVHRLLDAFALARDKRSASRLVIVGFGPDEDALKSRAQALGIADRVTWTGEASGVRMMSAFDIFALPSRYEAFPYVLLEAMASGLPIVSTRVGGVHELIREGENGFVVEQDDPAALADRLGCLLADPDRCRSMGTAAKEIVAGFDIATMVTATVEVYRTLMQRRQA